MGYAFHKGTDILDLGYGWAAHADKHHDAALAAISGQQERLPALRFRDACSLLLPVPGRRRSR